MLSIINLISCLSSEYMCDREHFSVTPFYLFSLGSVLIGVSLLYLYQHINLYILWSCYVFCTGQIMTTIYKVINLDSNMKHYTITLIIYTYLHILSVRGLVSQKI